MLLRLAFRNLLRQRRRNGLLGFGIGVGLGILVLAVSFAEGLSDLILNQFLANYTGHIEVSMTERSASVRGGLVLRDKEFFEGRVRKLMSGVKRIEEGATLWVQGVGLGASDNMMTLNGLPDSRFERRPSGDVAFLSGSLKEGDINNFLGSKSGGMLYEKKAKSLGLGVDEELQVRLRGVSGQAEVLRLNVAATLQSENFFQDTAVYVRLGTFKEVAGYRPFEAQSIKVILEDPRRAEVLADSLRLSLEPKVMVLPLRPVLPEAASEVLLGVAPNTEAVDYNLDDEVSVDVESLKALFPEDIPMGVVGLSGAWMERFGVGEGERVAFAYEPKFRPKVEVDFVAKEVPLPTDVEGYALVPVDFWSLYGYAHWPRDLLSEEALLLGRLTGDVGTDAFVRSWRLMPKSSSTGDIQVHYANLNATAWRGAALDVRTMRSMGSQFIQLEEALKSIAALTFVVVAFIILVGVVNTFNLSLRERTWEIGTMRALGFQRRQVAFVFLLEAFFLGLVASVVGVLFAFLLAELLSLYRFENVDMFAFFLKDKRVYFLVRVGPVASFVALAVGVTLGSAFFPAVKASRLRPDAALRRRL